MSKLLHTSRGTLVLLFYDGYELRADAGAIGWLKSNSRRVLRYTKRSLMRQQVHTGFYAAFLSLRDSLKKIDCDVRVNDFATARKHPAYPIGIAGYPSILAKIDLPNPRIFGPGDFGPVEDCATVAADPRMIRLIQPSKWFCDLYRPYCGDKLWAWFAGIDTQRWKDASHEKKTVDFLIYDKIRWHRDTRVASILERVTRHLDAKGHSYVVLRYGQHHHSQFVMALKRCRAMIFLCEHETQGLAYQEAMAMNLPILAWDEGELVDPYLQKYQSLAQGISSVPYFDESCGMKFKIADFETAYDAFYPRIATYRPRAFVESSLSMEIAGKAYLDEYARIAALPGAES